VCVCVCVCVRVCFFVPCAWPRFSADYDEIWHVASLHPKYGNRYAVRFLVSLIN